MGNLPAPFQPTIGLAIWTWLVFISLAIVLWKFVYPQILSATVAREQRIQKDLEDAERLRREAEATLGEQRELLASSRGEAQAILAEARQAAERERMLAIEHTRQEQEELLARARREIDAERGRAIAGIRREAVDLAIAAAGKVVGERMTAAEDRRLVEDYIASIGAEG